MLWAVSVTIVAALYLILVHGPNGQDIEINITEISSIRQIKKDTSGTSADHFARGVNCIVIMTNGKFIGVIETCPEVVEKIANLDDHSNEEKK